jgi:hypothetical protein
MRLVSPNVDASTSVLADWLELQSLLAGTRGATRSAIESIYRLTVEERNVRQEADEETNERIDGEISETGRDELILAILEEIEWRQAKLGPAYPFGLHRKQTATGVNWVLHGPSGIDSKEHAPYLTCLIIVALRRGLLDHEDASLVTDHRIGKLFQICACLAVGGYLDGEVVSFGWPRATGNQFFPALRTAWDRVGLYKIVEEYPAGVPTTLKDGGIDIIAWKDFADGRPARLIVFCQVASGDNWVDKSVDEPSRLLIGSFFVGYRPRAVMSATVIPFVAHEDASNVGVGIKDFVLGRMAYYEQAHGIILDRIRVAGAAHKALTRAVVDRPKIDGAERVAELIEWIAAVLRTTSTPQVSA